ncbi:TRAP transporter small permease [Sneathiella glossodoripedis]|uniref:TRAP transporter small permease n=1 Tax=Sneathiella glossodoripedis TaxID=418853 RepID=UPI00046F0743|nr:TRAP transporter small permease [Sneathiella glossodoripedis]
MKLLQLSLLHHRMEATLTMVAYGATAISLLGDVVGRELFDTGIWGAQRFAVYAAIVAGFLGMSLAAAEGENIRPQILDSIIPRSMNAFVDRLADFVSSGIYLILFYLAVGFVQASYENEEIAAVLDWPLWPIQMILPYAFLAVGIRYFAFAISPEFKEQFMNRVGKALYA